MRKQSLLFMKISSISCLSFPVSYCSKTPPRLHFPPLYVPNLLPRLGQPSSCRCGCFAILTSWRERRRIRLEAEAGAWCTRRRSVFTFSNAASTFPRRSLGGRRRGGHDGDAASLASSSLWHYHCPLHSLMHHTTTTTGKASTNEARAKRWVAGRTTGTGAVGMGRPR